MVQEPVVPPSGVAVGVSRQVKGGKSVGSKAKLSANSSAPAVIVLCENTFRLYLYQGSSRSQRSSSTFYCRSRHLFYSLKGVSLVLQSMKNSDRFGEKRPLGKIYIGIDFSVCRRSTPAARKVTAQCKNNSMDSIRPPCSAKLCLVQVRRVHPDEQVRGVVA